MIVICAVLCAILGLASPETYVVINKVPIGFVPVYNPPYAGREIQRPSENFNSRNVTNREITVGCLPHEYDLPGSHSGFYGCRKREDRLLFSENIFKPKRFLSPREKFIDYPGVLPKGHVRNETITAIWCYDARAYGKGGYCSIMGGGIGMKYVKVHIYHTERNVPLYYKIEIYGHTNTTGNARP